MSMLIWVFLTRLESPDLCFRGSVKFIEFLACIWKKVDSIRQRGKSGGVSDFNKNVLRARGQG